MSTNYIEMLRNNVCTVEFIKTDGSKRTMICTLKQDVLKKNNLLPSSSSSSRKQNDQQIRCVDLEKLEWRSFKVDKVVKFEINDVLNVK